MPISFFVSLGIIRMRFIRDTLSSLFSLHKLRTERDVTLRSGTVS